LGLRFLTGYGPFVNKKYIHLRELFFICPHTPSQSASIGKEETGIYFILNIN